MYEKKAIEKANAASGDGDSSDSATCLTCNREKTLVCCANCKHLMHNTRARRRCETHPREFFLMDVAACPQCRKKDLLELGVDEFPADFCVTTLSVSAVPFTPSTSSEKLPAAPAPFIGKPSPLVSVGEPMEVVSGYSGSIHSVASAVQVDCRNAQKRPRVSSRVVLPANVQQQTRQASVSVSVPFQRSTTQGHVSSGVSTALQSPTNTKEGNSCICGRRNEYLMCTKCGYYEPGVRKFKPCTQHPDNKQGIKFCPECGASSDHLDEN